MKYLFIIGFLLSRWLLTAQQDPEPPHVSVTGEAVVKVQPNYAILGIRIQKKLGQGADKPAFEIFKEEDTKLRLFDFNEADISKTLIQVDSTAYYKEVFVAIYDLKKLDKYLLELYNMGYRDYIYIDYRTSFYSRYKTQAKEEAMINARKKAQTLAGASGQTVGKAYSIEELNSEDYNWYELSAKKTASSLTFRLGSDNYLIEPGYITLTARVAVRFHIQ